MLYVCVHGEGDSELSPPVSPLSPMFSHTNTHTNTLPHTYTPKPTHTHTPMHSCTRNHARTQTEEAFDVLFVEIRLTFRRQSITQINRQKIEKIAISVAVTGQG